MFTAVRVCLRKYADFSGRATRSEYWWWTLAVLLGSATLTLLAAQEIKFLLALVAYQLAVLCPALAVAVRRLHDTGRSGWMLLLVLVPIVGGVVVTVLLAMPSRSDTNRLDAVATHGRSSQRRCTRQGCCMRLTGQVQRGSLCSGCGISLDAPLANLPLDPARSL